MFAIYINVKPSFSQPLLIENRMIYRLFLYMYSEEENNDFWIIHRSARSTRRRLLVGLALGQRRNRWVNNKIAQEALSVLCISTNAGALKYLVACSIGKAMETPPRIIS